MDPPWSIDFSNSERWNRSKDDEFDEIGARLARCTTRTRLAQSTPLAESGGRKAGSNDLSSRSNAK